jgi:hypothetical protein
MDTETNDALFHGKSMENNPIHTDRSVSHSQPVGRGINASHQSAYDLEIQDNLKILCSSKQFSSWQHEIRMKREQANEQNLLEVYFPLLATSINAVTHTRFVAMSFLIMVWNTVAVLVSLFQCGTIGQDSSFGLTALFFPLVLYLLHFQLYVIWHGRFLPRDIMLSNHFHDNNYRSLLNQMLIYLKECESIRRSTSIYDLSATDYTSAFFHPEANYESKWKYVIITIVYPLGVIILFVIYQNSEMSEDCAEFYISTAASLTTFYFFIVTIPIVLLLMNTIFISSKVVSALISSWMNRYLPLQRMKMEDIKQYVSSADRARYHASHIAEACRRDAYERYLFLYYYIHQISTIFGPAVVTILSVTTALFLWFFYLAFLVTSYFYVTIISWIIISAAVFFFTMSCLTSANRTVDHIYQVFKYSLPLRSVEITDDEEDGEQGETQTKPFLLKHDITSSKGDYEVIGGRQEWLDYIESNPIYWTVYGFAITQRWIQSFAVAAITAVVATIIPTISDEILA